jgi:two-component system phosphate regulon sensor histidine kinase PhoR
MMDELLFNLLENGIKYNKEGGLLRLELRSVGEEVRILVQDSGIGIKKEDLPRIFERFYRADRSRSKKSGGTGLGLSIVKHIAEFHDGSVEVESELGHGSTFICVLKIGL